jgi:hypothetical protein
MQFDPSTVDLSVFGDNPDAALAASAKSQIEDQDWAGPDVVNDLALWNAHIQSCGDSTYLTWCWKSTQAHQRPLVQDISYSAIRQAASVWLTMLKKGSPGWWTGLRLCAMRPIEDWAFAVASARSGDLSLFDLWCKKTYSETSLDSSGFQIFWELALLGSRESLQVDSAQSILWPYLLDTLKHREHHPAGLVQHILPQMGKYGPPCLPRSVSDWLKTPSLITGFIHEKHEPAFRWKHLWHAWLPDSWRQEISVHLVEIMERARAEGIAVTLPDEIRTIWIAGSSFDDRIRARLARAMLISPRIAQPNTWSGHRTEHWLDDVEHFYPEARILREPSMAFNGISPEVARGWLTLQAFPSDDINLPLLQLENATDL